MANEILDRLDAVIGNAQQAVKQTRVAAFEKVARALLSWRTGVSDELVKLNSQAPVSKLLADMQSDVDDLLDYVQAELPEGSIAKQAPPECLFGVADELTRDLATWGERALSKDFDVATAQVLKVLETFLEMQAELSKTFNSSGKPAAKRKGRKKPKKDPSYKATRASTPPIIVETGGKFRIVQDGIPGDAFDTQEAATEALEKRLSSDVVKGFPMGVVEGGIHVHTLDRIGRTTMTDGAHTHLFPIEWDFGDGPELIFLPTVEDGEHAHVLETSEATQSEVGGAHTHKLLMPDGTELVTNEDGEHGHELQVPLTAFDGLHQHTLTLASGGTITSMDPGQFWEAIGREDTADFFGPTLPASILAEPSERQWIAEEMMARLQTAKAAGLIKSEQFAPVNPSGDHTHVGQAVKMDEVVKHFDKPMALRKPAVFLTGGVCNKGETDNDLDFVIRGPLDDDTLHVVKVRLGRALPPELSKRAQFHDDREGGPFSNHIPLYDLVLVPHDSRDLVEMRKGAKPAKQKVEKRHDIRIYKTEEVAEERIVFGVVLIPDEVDAQGDTYSADEVRKAAFSFMELYGGSLKVMHKGEPLDGKATVIETYLSKQQERHGDETFPEGTWFMSSRVSDDDLWAEVKSGQWDGYSMGGSAIREPLS